jgi:hypothetical protein
LLIKNYGAIFTNIRGSEFLKIQSLALFITTYIDWVLMPFVTKLEGLHLPVYMISLFMLLGSLDGFIQPIFREIKIHKVYLFTALLDIIQILSYSIYFYSIKYFTYAILIVFTIQAITFEIARVHTIDFMQDEKFELKDYLMIRSLMISGAIVFGGISAILFDAYIKDILFLLIFLSFFGIYGIYLEFKLYLKFKRRLIKNKIIIEREKREMYEKFKV